MIVGWIFVLFFKWLGHSACLIRRQKFEQNQRARSYSTTSPYATRMVSFLTGVTEQIRDEDRLELGNFQRAFEGGSTDIFLPMSYYIQRISCYLQYFDSSEGLKVFDKNLFLLCWLWDCKKKIGPSCHMRAAVSMIEGAKVQMISMFQVYIHSKHFSRFPRYASAIAKRLCY